MKFHALHPREQLVTIMNRIYHGGMTTLSGGNLSIRDDNGDIWITPAGIDKGNLTPGDIMRVKADGTIEGPHHPSSEYPFHRMIYDQRPDTRAVVHAHAPALVVFSIVRQIPPTAITPWQVCDTISYAPYALTGTEALGASIAAALAGGCHAALLENHGVVTVGPDLLTAFQRLESLEFTARALINARRIGTVNVLDDSQLVQARRDAALYPEYPPADPDQRESDLRQQMIRILRRACERQLMISAAGDLSARVDDRRFLITPDGLDRRELEAEDLVLIDDRQREPGKVPARWVEMHRLIYAQHPAIRCIITAPPPHITAYAITAAPCDTRTIPESYILLRDVPLIPFCAPNEQIAATVSQTTPVALLQNEGVLVTGKSVLEAFDRLEVAEFSARSLIDATAVGPLQPMSEQAINALRAAFPIV
jgi:L-fuculose-phosphate aldolase